MILNGPWSRVVALAACVAVCADAWAAEQPVPPQCPLRYAFDADTGTGAARKLFGSSVAGAGDVDGDGHADVLVGAPGKGAAGTDPGRVHVYSGNTGVVLYTITGDAACDGFGDAVVGMGDADGDGVPDLAVGAPRGGSTGAGLVRIYSGKDGALYRTLVNLIGLENVGSLLAAPGDLDGDSRGDLIVAANTSDGNARVLVYSGKTGVPIRNFVPPGATAISVVAVDGAGDVNLDGHADFIIGGSSPVGTGKAHVLSGEPQTPPPPTPWRVLHELHGDQEDEGFGAAVAGAGDVDGDGWLDLIAASLGTPPSDIGPPQVAAVAYVFSGKTGDRLHTLPQTPPPIAPIVACMTQVPNVVVARLGDINDDGRADFLVGDRSAGFVKVYSGLDGASIFSAKRETVADRFGAAIAAAGDVNGDNLPDLLVGAPLNEWAGPEAGRAYVWILGDIDQDGITDICETCADIKPMIKAFPLSGTLTMASRSCLFQLRAPVGKTVLVSLTDVSDPAEPGDANAIYARWGTPPTPAVFDRAATRRYQASQRLVVPFARRETLYLLAQATLLGSVPNDVEIVHDIIDLALESLSVRSAGQGTGPLHARIQGGGFKTSTTFRLESADRSIEGMSPVIVSSERAEVIFDIAADVPAGSEYDLVTEKPDPQGGPAITARLRKAFKVEARRLGPRLEVELLGSERYRHGRLSSFVVRVTNVGDAEATAPLLKVTAVHGDTGLPLGETEFTLASEETFQREDLFLLGSPTNGVGGKLAPGAQVEVPISYRSRGCLECGMRLEVSLFTPGAGDVVGWDELEVPAGMSAEQWSELWPRLSVTLEAATWIEYGEALGRLATRSSRRGGESASVRELFRFAVREAYGRPSSAVAGTAREVETGIPLGGAGIVAIQDGLVRSSTLTDGDGNFALDWLEGGVTYQLAMTDFDLGEVAATPPAGGDLHGLELAGQAAATGIEAACPNCDESGLPIAPLSPPERLFTRVAQLGVAVVSSEDPNQKDGPAGQGDDGAIGLDQSLYYVIHFANEGGAPAQRVVVTDRLDSNLDASTLRIREVKLGEELIVLGTSAYDAYGASAELQVLATPAGEPALPRVLLGVSVQAELHADGMIEWVFASPNEDDFLGFLAAADPGSELDEGYVSFSVEPRQDLMDGTPIFNDADIGFDELMPVTTNEVENRIHLDLPPDAPRNPRPADGAEAIEAETALSWEPAARARRYDVYLWAEAEDPPAEPTAPDLPSSRLLPAAPLELDTLYRWRVVARSAGGEVSGPEWTFRTASAPSGCPVLNAVEPMDGQGGVAARGLTLEWDADPEADGYAVRLWRAGVGVVVTEARGIARAEHPVRSQLLAATAYQWQVTAWSGACEIPGPVWSFLTAANQQEFRRGDANADDKVNISDAITTLNFLFAGTPRPPPCLKALDADDDGELNITDAIFELSFLFLGGPEPPPPGTEQCGVDPTDDEITCDAPACGLGVGA